jgi:hypothetical protein
VAGNPLLKPMKNLTICLASLASSIATTSLLAQGTISWSNLVPNPSTLISVNGSPMPARVSPGTTYYFGLFIAPLGTPPPAYGMAGEDDPNWQYVVAYATNSTVATGRIVAATATVIGYAAGSNVNFIVRAWEASGGATWPLNWLNINNIGQSAVGTAVLGGAPFGPPQAFGGLPGQISGFNYYTCLGCNPPSFVTNPSNTVLALGSDATFTAYAFHWPGPNPPGPSLVESRYQWRKQGSPIASATNSYLTLPNVTLNDAGTYDVVATGTYGSTPSAVATLTVFVPGIAATLGSPAYTTNNQFQFTVTGTAGSNYVVQVAHDLSSSTTWLSLFTNTSPFTFVDSYAQRFPQRFYRVQAR